MGKCSAGVLACEFGGRLACRYKKWLPNMDSNHDKQIQSLLCYRYTIRQFELEQTSYFCPTVKPPRLLICPRNTASF